MWPWHTQCGRFLCLSPHDCWAPLLAQMVKSPPAMQETQVQPLDWEDPLEEEMATHCIILAWRIPWTEEPGGLYSPLGYQESDMGWGGAVPRWQRNRTGRPLSPQQIHQKIIWMLSNIHRTTSELWWRIPGTQKGTPFSSKGGKTKYKRQKERQKS